MNTMRILVLMHELLVPPDTLEGHSEKEILEWRTEFDVVQGLRKLGHEVKPLGVYSDLTPIRQAIDEFKPRIVFNLLEEFHAVQLYDHAVVSFLELMRTPYTGCNPRGLMLARDKALAKKILLYHRVPVPRFAVFPVGRKVHRPRKLGFPLLVKSQVDEGSVGIAQASVVNDDEKLAARVAHIHEHLGSDAIAEEYIDGRELYCSVIGNQRLDTFVVWELLFTKLRPDAPRIATERVKWDEKYQQQIGIKAGPAENLPDGMGDRIKRLCKRVYRILGLSGYARMDLRLAEDGRIYLIEVNPNPELAVGSEFPESSRRSGMEYGEMLQRIINLGLNFRAHWRKV